MIVPYEVKHTSQVIKLCEEMHKETCYSKYPFSHERVHAELQRARIGDDWKVFVAEKGNSHLVGMMVGYIATPPFTDCRIAYEYLIFVTKTHRQGLTALKLLREFKKWAESENVVSIVVGTSTGVKSDNVARMYQSIGYEPFGQSFIKHTGV